MPSLRKMMLLAACVMLFAALVLPLAVGAQTANETINLGDTVNGTLESGHLSAQYVFFGNRGDVVTVTLESEQLDGYLTLLDPGLNEVASDDDSGGGSNPSISDTTLKTTGDFTIVVDSYNRLQTGDFSLSLTGTLAPEVTETPEATAGVSTDDAPYKGDIEFGQSITETITSDISAYNFHFVGQPGQHVTITLTSSDFDAYLKLISFEAAGLVVLAEDDDSAGNLNAEIRDFVLPDDASASYSIWAGSYGGGVDGEFTLSLTEAGTTVTPTEVVGTPQPTPTLIPTPGTVVTLPANGDVTPINIGDTVNGTIATFDNSKVYSFAGQSGQSVTITAESDAFDTYLQLFDADGRVVAEDDDSAGNLNAEIQDFPLTADGLYTVSVGSFGGGASGDFRLSLTAQVLFAQPTATSATPEATSESTVFTTSPAAINIGDTINGTLPEDSRSAIYTFSGSAGQTVTITLSSTDFDSYLSLKDSSGEEIAYDDDSAGNLNAKIQDFTLPADGTYTIQATSFGSFVTGSFTLTLESGTGVQPTPEATTTASNGGAISLNERVTGTLTETDSHVYYTFEGETGQVVTVTLESNDFDAYLTLLRPDGDTIATDDDSAGNLNARIANFSLPESGTYTLVVSGSSGFSTGSFTLSTATAAVQPTATPIANAPGTISLGETVNGALIQGPNAHTFAGKAGQVVTIELDSTAFDAYVQLKDSNEIELASDDDSAGNLNARIENFRLPADDTYSIVVSSFDNTATGDYTLTLSEGGGTVTPVPPTNVPAGSEIAIGDTVNGTLSGGSLTASYTFQGEAGQIVTITATSEDFDSYLRLLDSSATELITDDDSAGNLDSRIAFYALPSSDTYTIVVESFDSAGGSYSLSLSAAEVEPIEYTQTINGELTESQSSAGYRFSGAAGDVITITLRSSAFDAYLSLNQGGSGSSYALITDDDSAGGSDARIGPYTLPATGEYIITVSSYDSTVTGAYTLELNRAVLSPIDFDQPVTADITAENSTLYYSFEGKTGDVIDIEADSGGSVDTSLSLTGPDNYQITSDDDSGKDFDPEITHLVLASDGTYTIGLSAYSAGDTGTVTLLLTRAPLRSLDDGPQEVRLNEKITQDVLTFTGGAGQNYQLWVQVRDGVGSPNVTITQNGTAVATGSASTSTALLVAFIVPEDGPVTVQITDYSYAKVVMNVRVETVGE